MADIELVIKIPEDSYKATCDGCMLPTDVKNVVQGIKNGTPQPEIPPYIAEIEAEYKKWINVPYIRKPLTKALYEVWKKHDREDAEREDEE